MIMMMMSRMRSRLRRRRQEYNLNENLFFRQAALALILLARATSCLSKVMILLEVELLRPFPLGK